MGSKARELALRYSDLSIAKRFIELAQILIEEPEKIPSIFYRYLVR